MSDEKELDLRDKIALEILNGILSNASDNNSMVVADVRFYINHKDASIRDTAAERMEDLIRSCYRLADIVRKVRLTAFL